MKKPELLITAGSLEELERVIDAGADAVQVGESRFGLRLPGEFRLPELAEAVRLAHGKEAKVYVAVNGIMDNAILPELPDYIRSLHELGADAVIFGDPAVLMAMRRAEVSMPLHWSTEMTSTNYVTANYWAGKGATRVFLARELNLEQVIETKRHALPEVQVQVHGMTNIYHSKRSLVSHYAEHLRTGTLPEETVKDILGDRFDAGRRLVLIETERPGERYPVYEDRGGTHIMSADDICMLENLHELMEAGIDSFKIEGLMKPALYNETVVRSYRQAIDRYCEDPERYAFCDEWLEAIAELQDPRRELTYGFYYKEQVY